MWFANVLVLHLEALALELAAESQHEKRCQHQNQDCIAHDEHLLQRFVEFQGKRVAAEGRGGPQFMAGFSNGEVGGFKDGPALRPFDLLSIPEESRGAFVTQ